MYPADQPGTARTVAVSHTRGAAQCRHGASALVRRHLFVLRLMLLAADAVMAAVFFLLLGNLRFGDAAWTTMWQALGMSDIAGALFYAAAWVTILWFLGLYAFRVRWTIGGELNEILVGSLLMAFATMTFLYLIKLDVSRLFLLVLLVGQPVITMASRVSLRLWFQRMRARGFNRSFMVVVGVGEEAQAFADVIERHPELGIEVIGHLVASDEVDSGVTRPILGSGEDLARVFHERVVDEVAICVAPRTMDWSEPLIRLAADEGKHVRIPTRAEPPVYDLSTEELDGLLIRSYVHGPTRMLSLAVKRAMDVGGALVGLVILGPVVAVVAVAILVTEGRPIHYHHTRIGLHGRPFTMYKFRTMVRDADARFNEVLHLNERASIAFKSGDDPRITKLGKFLRATSIDELPQLWNVLRGEMSLVGPRPPLEREIVGYDIWHRRRLSMKPGITGLWQVEARGEPEFDRWVERDLEYIDRWTLGLDLKILLRTVPAVVGRTGK